MIFRFRKSHDTQPPPGVSEPPLEPGFQGPGLAGAVRYQCECLDCNEEVVGGVATAIAFQMRHLTCALRITNIPAFAAAAAQLVAETEQFLGVTK